MYTPSRTAIAQIPPVVTSNPAFAMKTSKFAPKTPAERLTQSRAERLVQDKERTTRLLVRLQWKAELLMTSQLKAIQILQEDSQQNAKDDPQPISTTGARGRQAESMFKIDFFEFYTLLERYITDSLAILGFTVSATAPRNNFNTLRYMTNPDLHKTRPLASHAFHANLLEALDDEKCPLHSSFGTQRIRVQLGLAKDYRNAWKGADEKLSLTQNSTNSDTPRTNVQLHDLQLEVMLRALFEGCELAHAVVQNHSETNSVVSTFTSRDYEPRRYGHSSMDIENMPYEYMDDAMDLD